MFICNEGKMSFVTPLLIIARSQMEIGDTVFSLPTHQVLECRLVVTDFQ